MKLRHAPLLVTLAVFVSACENPTDLDAPASVPSPSFSVQQQAERVVPGRVLVKLSEGTDAEAFAQSNGIAFERNSRANAFGLFRGAVGNERALAARLRGDERVEWAEPDYLRQTTQIDPRLWAFYNPGDLFVRYTRGRTKNQPVNSYRSVEDADVDNIEGYASEGGPVSIASIDTGVDFGHPEFGGLDGATLVPAGDYYSNDGDPSDENDHGTHTTGTMTGKTVGIAGVAGAAGNVTVFVYRVCGALGCPSSAIAQAIRDAATRGVVAMNLSLGGGSLGQGEADAIAFATSQNALVIASAGNDGVGSVSCPACDPNAISVAATDWLDQQAYYTNYGPGLDISAPGGELYSNTTEEAGIYSSVRGGYAYFQGTSMSAPQVTGTAAIVASMTTLRGGALRSRILGSADAIGSSNLYGAGRVNAYRAVTQTTLNEGPVDPPAEGLAASFTYGCSGTVCTFDASSSTGSITSYTWSGSLSATGVTTTYDFGAAGTFPVTLTVSDGTTSDSASDTVSCRVRGKSVRCN